MFSLLFYCSGLFLYVDLLLFLKLLQLMLALFVCYYFGLFVVVVIVRFLFSCFELVLLFV